MSLQLIVMWVQRVAIAMQGISTASPVQLLPEVGYLRAVLIRINSPLG